MQQATDGRPITLQTAKITDSGICRPGKRLAPHFLEDKKLKKQRNFPINLFQKSFRGLLEKLPLR